MQISGHRQIWNATEAREVSGSEPNSVWKGLDKSQFLRGQIHCREDKEGVLTCAWQDIENSIEKNKVCGIMAQVLLWNTDFFLFV